MAGCKGSRTRRRQRLAPALPAPSLAALSLAAPRSDSIYAANALVIGLLATDAVCGFRLTRAARVQSPALSSGRFSTINPNASAMSAQVSSFADLSAVDVACCVIHACSNER